MLDFTRAARSAAPLFCAVTALVVVTLHSVAAENKPVQLIATVNLATVHSDAWLKYKGVREDLEKQKQVYLNVIHGIVGDGKGDATVPPLDPDTINKWLDLKLKVETAGLQASQPDKDQLLQYEAQGKQATDRLNALIQKSTNLTEAEKTEYEKLSGLRAQTEETVNTRFADYQKKLQEIVGNNSDTLDKLVNAAIKQVADERNISYVLNSPPVGEAGETSPVVLYSTDPNLNITNDIITKLNKMK